MVTPIKSRSDLYDEFTPQKRFDIELDFDLRTGEPRHSVRWTPNTQKWCKKNAGTSLIYSIKVDGKRKIGQTAIGLKRFPGYMTLVNKAFKDPSFTADALTRDLVKKTEKASVGIIGYEKDAHEADKWERDCINYHDTINTGYNVRNGGGGGRPADPGMKLKKKHRQQIRALVRESYQDSTQWRTVEKVRKLVKGKWKNVVQFSFSERENKRYNQIYLLRHVDPKTGRETLYIGETTTTVKERMAPHRSHINNPQTERHQHQKIYQLMHQEPKNCSVALLNTRKILEKYPQLTTHQIEGLAREALMSDKREIVSKKGGGGVRK